MLTSNNEVKETKELLDKPFASIRFVMIPPEELKALNIDLKGTVLFLEVVHGNETGILNKQWIPLFLESATCFNTKTIMNFIHQCAQDNKYTPFILPTPEATLGTKLTLCIPILSGECQLAFTPDGNVFINRVPSDLDLTIETVGTIETNADTLCRKVYFSAKKILNEYSLVAEMIKLKTVIDYALRYSFCNRGHIAATESDFIFEGHGILHEGGTLTAKQNMWITGINIKLVASTIAEQDIALRHGGGIWIVSDKVQAIGELGFYWIEGVTVTTAYKVSGSLKYVLSAAATKPLCFMANQTAEAGTICIETPTPLMIGDNKNFVEFKSQALILHAKSFIFYNGRLLSINSISLKTLEEIILGKIKEKKPNEENKENKEKEEVFRVAMLCHGFIEMEGNGVHEWNELEMTCEGNFRLTGNGSLVNTSSQVQIKGDAVLGMPTRHQLLIKEEANSAEALTKPSTVIIEGGLSSGNNALDIFASNFSCREFKGTMPELKDKSFTPFTTGTETYQSGVHEDRHTFHRPTRTPLYSTRAKVVLGEPINASFSVGSDLKVSIPHFDVSGICSAISVTINEIQRGLLGQFDTRVSVAPMVFKPFKDQVSLLNYFDPTSLYEISPGGETVFKSVLPMPLYNFMPRLPRMLLREDGTLGVSPGHLRRLLPREKEEVLLTKMMLGEFGRGFLNRNVNTPQSVMQYFEANAIRYSKSAQKLITAQSPGMALQQTANNALSVTQPNFVGEALPLAEPCIVDAIETIVFEDGQTETVLVPTAFFPKHFDNRRLRDGAGCLFTLEDIKLSGVPGSALHIRGNVEGEEIVIEGLETLSRTRNTWTRYETVTHESKHKSLFGKNNTTVSFQEVAITELQPGNQMVARKGVHLASVKNVYISGARDQLGAEGLTVENADTFVDAAIVRNKIGTTVAVNQKGFLGLGGSSTSVTPVLQEAIGSEITTAGPVHIQARFGQFDATQFRVTEGAEPKFEFEISELHFHELLRVIEAHNKASEAALLLDLREQARTAKRKSRQSTTLLLISIPVCYYVNGLITGYLESVMGVTLSGTVVNGTVVAKATAAQATAIVGLSGMGSGLVGAAIQNQPLAKGAINGAVFSLIGHGIENAPVLAGQSALVKDVASGVVVGSTTAVLNHGNIIESALIGGAASAIAGTVVPGPEKNLSMTESVSKAVIRSAAAVVLNDGTVDDLAINLASASMGAAIGKEMSDLGGEHGTALATRQGFNVSTAPASNITSVATSSSSSRVDGGGKPPVNPSSPSTRAYGLGDSTFDRELNVAHQSAQDLFFDVELECSFNYTTKGFARTWTEDSVETKYRFDEPPVLLWSAPNRLNRTSGYTFGSKSAVAQESERSLNQSSFGIMALRALFGEKSPEILAWQRQNRERMPGLAERYDDFYRAHEELHVGTRVSGFLQTVEGTAEIGVGFVTGPIGPLFATMGADNVMTGLHTMWTGESQATTLLRLTTELGRKTDLYNPETAAYIEMGLNILAPGSVFRPSVYVKPSMLTFSHSSGATKTRLTIQREIFPEVDFVEHSLQNANSHVRIRRFETNTTQLEQPSVLIQWDGVTGSISSAQNVFSKETQKLLGVTDRRYKSQLFERPGKTKSQTTLRAAQIELQGKQIPLAIERRLTYNHMEKVENAQDGLLQHIEKINNRLGHPELPIFERRALQQELSKTSKLLDYSEQFLPRPRPAMPVESVALGKRFGL